MRHRTILSMFFFLAWALVEATPGGREIRAAWADGGSLNLEMMSEVQVEHRRVRLLDLFPRASVPDDVRTVLARTDIGEAPSVGSEKVIHRDQLKTYLGRLLSPLGYDEARVQLKGAESLTVRRASVQVPRERIETIYREFIAARAPWDAADVVVRGVSFSGAAVELPAGDVSHEVVANPNERFLGNVAVTIHFFVDGEKERSVRATGKVDVFRNVVHAIRTLRRNEVIQASDVEYLKINIADAPDRFATQLDQVVGKRILREVGFHQPMALADLDQPLVLKRGAAVTILYEKPGLRLSAKGQAKEEGGSGDTIRVLNVTTNKIVLCQIVDETTVRAVP